MATPHQRYIRTDGRTIYGGNTALRDPLVKRCKTCYDRVKDMWSC